MLENLKKSTTTKQNNSPMKNGISSPSSPPNMKPSLRGMHAGIPTDYASREIRALETRYFEVLGRLRRMEAPKVNISRKENETLRVMPSGRSTHRDALLEEMKWLANDFHSERRWKRNASLHVSDAVAKYHLQNANDVTNKKRNRVVVVSNSTNRHVRCGVTRTASPCSRDPISVTDALSVAEIIREETPDEKDEKYQNVPTSQRRAAFWLQKLQSHGLGACLLRPEKESYSLRSEEVVCQYVVLDGSQLTGYHSNHNYAPNIGTFEN